MIHVTEQEDILCVKMVTKPGRMGKTVYMYLVDGMLIDTGPVIMQEELIPFFKKHSFDLVMLTLSHEDHSGMASWIQENRNVPIYIHPKGKDICESPVSYLQYRKDTWGIRQPFDVLPAGQSINSNNFEWKVIFTPRHANDHVSLFHEENGRLFAGDLYLSPETKIMMKDESVPLIIESIKKILKLNFGSLFCSHTGLVADGRSKLKQKLSFLEELYGIVEELYLKGYSPDEINDRLFPKKYRLIEISEGEYDTFHMVASIIRDI